MTEKMKDFNSTIVRLKGTQSRARSAIFLYFNSTIVRLKVSPCPCCSSCDSNFNSTIVRLKVIHVVQFRAVAAVFQFYDSTIKSIEETNMKLVAVKLFQFYDSTIKRNPIAQNSWTCLNFNSTIVRLKEINVMFNFSTLLQFQFYDSTIKSFADISI